MCGSFLASIKCGRALHRPQESALGRLQYNVLVPKTDSSERLIAENRRARYDYFIEDRLEAGLVLEGWEVKSMRAGRAQLAEAYVYVRNGEAFLIGAHLAPLRTASTHKPADPVRTRKLLLHRNELDRLIGATERRGYTIVPLELYWKARPRQIADRTRQRQEAAR
jgi:SsrA-binding protein